MSALLADFFRHNAWANQHLLDACAGLTEQQLDATAPGTYGSIRDTLVHLIGAEKRYLAALNGVELERPLGGAIDLPGFAALREQSRRSGDDLIEVARRTPPSRNVRGVRGGEPFAIPAAVFLMQAIDHATEHRTHIRTILTTLGIEPPDLDAWTFMEQTPAAPPSSPGATPGVADSGAPHTYSAATTR
jgi:uncharacterized damage-inducible protein DinB